MGQTSVSNEMSGCHLANAWRSRLKHILQWQYYTAMKLQFNWIQSINVANSFTLSPLPLLIPSSHTQDQTAHSTSILSIPLWKPPLLETILWFYHDMVSSSCGTIAQPLLVIFDVFVGAFQFVGCFRQIEYLRTLFRMGCIPSMHTASQTLSGYDLLCTCLSFKCSTLQKQLLQTSS